VTVLQPTPDPRRLLKRTFLGGWAVAGAVCVVIALHAARGVIGAWIGALGGAALLPAAPLVFAGAGLDGNPGLGLGCATFGLLPVGLWRLGRHASPRTMVWLACGMALWWMLLLAAVILVSMTWPTC
jgi:hypothetical protein